MKLPITLEPNLPVDPTTTNVWERRVEQWDYVGICVKNTGAEAVNLTVCTRTNDGIDYAIRDVYTFTSVAPGESKQFDADISGSLWVALIGTAAGAGSTVDLSVLFRKVNP
jgi:hypothetical protein